MIDARQPVWAVAQGDCAWMTPNRGPLMAEAGIGRTVLLQAAEAEDRHGF